MHILGGRNHNKSFQIPYPFLQLAGNIKIYKHEILLRILEFSDPPSLLPKAYLDLFSRVKAAGAWNKPLLYLVMGLMSGSIPSLPHTSSWLGA
jgi:hypothetical protein